MKIYAVTAGAGMIGVAPMPGAGGDLAGDIARIVDWGAGMVLTMTTAGELSAAGAGALGDRLRDHGIAWHHLPIRDFGAPPPDVAARWAGVSAEAHALLDRGGQVLTHCRGGCGRSGMAALRLLVETGEPADDALARLRAARPCAVETAAQMAWARG